MNKKEPAASKHVDEEFSLVEQATKGDLRSFERLIELHRAKIYAMILAMTKNKTDAWDLSQDVFIKAWQALPSFERRASFSTWLFRIAHNTVYDWARRKKPQEELNEEVFSSSQLVESAPTTPSHPPTPDQALYQKERAERIAQAIAKLSKKHREIILLREVQGFDYSEIASILDITRGTVMSRLHYARQILQSELSDLMP